ncbi:TPA: DUF2207 domain-containing protein [bacterium]|jgi:uncharacterized membrane protein|nr:DUF2207 domain-containing protein [bacterium]
MKRNLFGILFAFSALLGATLLIIYLSSLPPSIDDYGVYAKEFNVDIKLDDNGDALATYTIDTHVNDSYSVRYFTFNDPYQDYEMEVLSLYINDQKYTKSEDRAPLSDMNPSEYYGQYYFGYSNGEYIIEYYFPRNENFDQKIVMDLKFKDFVKVHEDYADLYYMIARNYDFPIYNMKVNIELPSDVAKDDIYSYGYGPVDGKIGEDKLSFEASNLDANERFEIRVLVPSGVFTKAPKLDGVILDDVIKENEIAMELVKKDAMLIYICFILAFIVSLIIISYNIYIKSKYPRFKGINRGSINRIPDMDPILAGKLYRYYSIDVSNDLFVSALLSLAKKKVISIDVSGNKKKPTMSYTLIDNDPQDLTNYERDIVHLLFTKLSPDGVNLTDKDIEKYAKKNTTSFSADMAGVKSEFNVLFNKQNWVDTELNKYNVLRFSPILLNIILIITGFIFVMIEPKLTNWIFFLIIGAINVGICAITILIITGPKFTRLTQQGEDKYEEIKAFANYLQDYTLINEKLVQDLVMWENYLVYAVALGIADKVIKQLEKKFDTVIHDPTIRTSYLYSFMMMRSYGVSPYQTISNIGKVTFSPQRYVSGSSGGGRGGFSSGGGGGRGGGGSGGR